MHTPSLHGPGTSWQSQCQYWRAILCASSIPPGSVRIATKPEPGLTAEPPVRLEERLPPYSALVSLVQSRLTHRPGMALYCCIACPFESRVPPDWLFHTAGYRQPCAHQGAASPRKDHKGHLLTRHRSRSFLLPVRVDNGRLKPRRNRCHFVPYRPIPVSRA